MGVQSGERSFLFSRTNGPKYYRGTLVPAVSGNGFPTETKLIIHGGRKEHPVSAKYAVM